MKIYIATAYELRDHAISVMHHLEALGHEVTSGWLHGHVGMDDEHARRDLADVLAADLLLLLNPADYAEKGTGGRHVEVGYALALNIPVVIVGVRSNIFHHLDRVRVIGSVGEL